MLQRSEPVSEIRILVAMVELGMGVVARGKWQEASCLDSLVAG